MPSVTVLFLALFGCATTSSAPAGPEFVDQSLVRPESSVVPAKRVSSPTPDITQYRTAGEPVEIVVRGVVSTVGKFQDLKVVRTNLNATTAMVQVVLETLGQWKLEPATIDGTPADSYLTFTLSPR